MDSAANYLRAELLPHKASGWALAVHWAKMIFGAMIGDTPTSADLVVYRRESGAEIMRTPADVGSPEILLAQVEDDLRTKTVIEFLAEWRLETDLI
jgi:hypothetical protein